MVTIIDHMHQLLTCIQLCNDVSYLISVA